MANNVHFDKEQLFQHLEPMIDVLQKFLLGHTFEAMTATEVGRKIGLISPRIKRSDADDLTFEEKETFKKMSPEEKEVNDIKARHSEMEEDSLSSLIKMIVLESPPLKGKFAYQRGRRAGFVPIGEGEEISFEVNDEQLETVKNILDSFSKTLTPNQLTLDLLAPLVAQRLNDSGLSNPEWLGRAAQENPELIEGYIFEPRKGPVKKGKNPKASGPKSFFKPVEAEQRNHS